MNLDRARRIQSAIMEQLLGFRPVKYAGRWPGAPPVAFNPPASWATEKIDPFAPPEQLPESVVIGTAIQLPRALDPNGYRLSLLCQRLSDTTGRIAFQARHMARGELDVVYIGRAEPLGATAPKISETQKTAKGRQNAVKYKIGDLVRRIDPEAGAGTLGCRVTIGSNPGQFFLTNEHVLNISANTPDIELADAVAKPTQVAAKVHTLGGLIPSPYGGPAIYNDADCAVAEMKGGHGLDCGYVQGAPDVPNALPIQGLYPSAVSHQMEVLKVGIWGGTFGRLTCIDASVTYPMTVNGQVDWYSFSAQYAIEDISIGGVVRAFASPGDSGSVVFTQDVEAVGLLFLHALSDQGQGPKMYYFASPLPAALDKVNAKFSL